MHVAQGSGIFAFVQTLWVASARDASSFAADFWIPTPHAPDMPQPVYSTAQSASLVHGNGAWTSAPSVTGTTG